MTVTTVQDLSVFIKESRDGLLREGGLGAVFAILTIFLFLLSLRATIVAAISIPLSILTALVVMQLTGVTINILTLGGLAVAVGRVVDDAIVVLENIYRHRALGEDRRTAAINGPKEVAGAITASTLTTVAVFLPLGFVGGLVSQFFLPFALTVTFALLASLVCALTVVPVLAYFLLDRVKVDVDANGEPVRSHLGPRLHADHPVRPPEPLDEGRRRRVAAMVLFFASAALAPLLPTQFINAGSEKTLVVTVAPPTGASSDAVLAKAVEAETILLADEDVALVQTSIPGDGGTSSQAFQSAQLGRATNSATMTVRLDEDADVAAATTRLATALEPVKSDGYDATVSSGGGFTSNGLRVIVTGETADDVAKATDAVLAGLADQPDLLNLQSDLVKATPEVQVTVDPNKAITRRDERRPGLEPGALRPGRPERDLGPIGGRTDDLGHRPTRSDGRRLGRRSQGPARRHRRQGPARADRGRRAGRRPGQHHPHRPEACRRRSPPRSPATTRAPSRSRSRPSSIRSPRPGRSRPATTAELAGVSQQQAEAFGGLFASMGVAILLVYVMMVLTFNSLITPFIILFTLPLATIGAFPALYLSGRPIGVSALIGFLMLIGIVVTNAIVLLDLVERLRAEGHSTKDALIEGGRTRVRPILMTAIATILALIPLAAGFNQGSIIAAELGTVVIGGLFSATFLTLVVIPVVYSLVDGLKVRVGRRLDRSGASEAPPEPAAI